MGRDSGWPQKGQPGQAGQGQAFSPKPAHGLLHKSVSKEISPLASGEILHAPINWEVGEAMAALGGWGGTQCPLGAALPKAHTHTQMLTMAQN